MAARSGMAAIITEIRERTDTAVDDYIVGGVSYWTDEHLQNVADRYRTDFLDLPLLSVPKEVDGVTSWIDYYIPKVVGPFVESSATTGAFGIVNSIGEDAPSNTVNLLAGHVTFDVDTTGFEYFIRCRSYNLDAVAAEIWGKKAAHRVNLIDWKAGSHTLYEDQEYQHCLQMQQFYSASGGLVTVRMSRRDYQIRERW